MIIKKNDINCKQTKSKQITKDKTCNCTQKEKFPLQRKFCLKINNMAWNRENIRSGKGRKT